MLSLRLDLLPVSAVLLLPWLPASGQSVISAHSGVVHFFEGSVYVGDCPLEPQFGKFPDIADGADLRTTQGRAEILLTPGAILRIAENSAIRMLSSDLSDTRVELVRGSGIVESMEARSENSVMLIYKNWQVRFPRQGVYRIDSEPPQLRVYHGEAEVSVGGDGTTVAVKAGQILLFSAILVPDQSTNETGDAFSDWAMDRSQAISADNAIAAQIVDDPSSIDSSGLAVWGFTYFPRIGIPTTGASLLSPYGFSSWTPYSIYLPGYIYRPFYPGWPGGVRYPPLPRFGIPPRTGVGMPRGGITSPAPHISPPSHIPPPHVGVNRGGHR